MMTRFLLLILTGSAVTQVRSATDPGFEKDIRPILKEHCTHCHGEEPKPAGGVDLRLRRFMDDILVPGDPDASLLVQVIRSGDMPEKGKKVSPASLSLIEQWIAKGAKTSKPEPEHLAAGSLITEEDKSYWAFQPIQRPASPEPGDLRAPVRTPVDAFLLRRLQDQGLQFAEEADRITLIRRVTLDLTGLTPTPAEVEAFVQDPSPRAYEDLVDRLLASERYGERWARHWLDVAGYADSNGYAEADSIRPHAWRYRDYVIRSLNEDKPWDRFIQEQLAGDELAAAHHEDYQQAVLDPQRRDQLIATGFLRTAPDGSGDKVDDTKLAIQQNVAEQLQVITSALTGLSVACAQCHDHRYDPITQADYYRLRAIFDPAFRADAWRNPGRRQYSLYTPEQRAEAERIEAQAKAIEQEARDMNKAFLDEIFEEKILTVPEPERAAFREARATPKDQQTAEQKALITKYPAALATYSLNLYDKDKQALVDAKMAEANQLRSTKPAEAFITAVTELPGETPPTPVFHRGDHEQPGELVAPGEISVLCPQDRQPVQPEPTATGTSGRRLAYAQWLTSGHHPLTARVLVNRFWLHHMGRGLVNTPAEFGRLGEPPSHPELLDWLAAEFMRSGWKLKPFHRLILLSQAYRQASVNPPAMEADPENRLYGRFTLRRLDAESLRDSLLALTGHLVLTSDGPPSEIGKDPQGRVVPGIDKGTLNKNIVEPAGAADFRRSIYLQVRRSRPVTLLDTFDAPVMTPNCEMRHQTTVAPQSLLLMNDSFVLETAARLAERLMTQHPESLDDQLQSAWQQLFLRPATNADLERCKQYLAQQTRDLAAYYQKNPKAKTDASTPERDSLASLCQILISSNRFLYMD